MLPTADRTVAVSSHGRSEASTSDSSILFLGVPDAFSPVPPGHVTKTLFYLQVLSPDITGGHSGGRHCFFLKLHMPWLIPNASFPGTTGAHTSDAVLFACALSPGTTGGHLAERHRISIHVRVP